MKNTGSGIPTDKIILPVNIQANFSEYCDIHDSRCLESCLGSTHEDPDALSGMGLLDFLEDSVPLGPPERGDNLAALPCHDVHACLSMHGLLASLWHAHVPVMC